MIIFIALMAIIFTFLGAASFFIWRDGPYGTPWPAKVLIQLLGLMGLSVAGIIWGQLYAELYGPESNLECIETVGVNTTYYRMVGKVMTPYPCTRNKCVRWADKI